MTPATGGPLPPPLPPPCEPAPGLWRRFQGRPRWQRWTAYGGAAVLALGAVGAAVGEPPDEQTITTPTASTPGTTPASAAATIVAAAPSTTPPPPTPVATTTPATAPPTTPATAPPTPPPVTPPPTAAATTIPGSLDALDVLALIPVTNEHQDGYDRERFGYPADRDGDSCDTRDEVLQRDSLTPAQVDPAGCQVIAGDWLSPYDGVTQTDPAEIQIDHVVALKEAHDSGAWAWGPDRLIAYGNDLDDARSLRAVTGTVNNDKGDKDPSNWLPPDPNDLCRYLADWTAIKARWGLSMDQSEAGRIRNLITDNCPGLLIAPWPEAPPDTPTTTTPPPIQPAIPQGPDRTGCDPSYPTVCIPPPPPDLDCGDIPYRRFQVLPPDPHNFDGGSKNGIGCESG